MELCLRDHIQLYTGVQHVRQVRKREKLCGIVAEGAGLKSSKFTVLNSSQSLS